MKRKKDVLFLCQFFHPEYISSATLPYDTALALQRAGYQVEVMTGYPKEYNLEKAIPKKEVHKNMKIDRLKYLQLKRTSTIGRLINYFSFTTSVFLNFLKLRKYKSIIVYSNPPILPLITAMAAKIYKTKVIFVSYDIYPEIAEKTKIISENSIMSKMMKIVNKIVFKNVHKVIALSAEMKKYIIKHREISKDQVEIIPNWYDDQGKIEESKKIKTDLFLDLEKQDKFVVSYFGNLGVAQELDTIVNTIRHFKDNDDLQFMFAGHGNKMDLLKDIIKKENLVNVKMFGFLQDEYYEDALNVSNCYIVSLAEGLTGLAVPSKTYSYMMAGKPILAIIGEESDIAKDLINNNAGYILEVGEESIMINAINELKNNKKKQISMGINCRNVYLSKYTKEKCTMKYVELMETVLEGK